MDMKRPRPPRFKPRTPLPTRKGDPICTFIKIMYLDFYVSTEYLFLYFVKLLLGKQLTNTSNIIQFSIKFLYLKK